MAYQSSQSSPAFKLSQHSHHPQLSLTKTRMQEYIPAPVPHSRQHRAYMCDRQATVSKLPSYSAHPLHTRQTPYPTQQPSLLAYSHRHPLRNSLTYQLSARPAYNHDCAAGDTGRGNGNLRSGVIVRNSKSRGQTSTPA